MFIGRFLVVFFVGFLSLFSHFLVVFFVVFLFVFCSVFWSFFCRFLQALSIRLKLHGDEYIVTGWSHYWIGLILYRMNDYDSALKSHQQALNIRLKLYGDEDTDTAWSYYWIGLTQYKMNDYDSALKSHQQALEATWGRTYRYRLELLLDWANTIQDERLRFSS